MSWFCLSFLLLGCVPDAATDNKLDGTYIGYYHHNQQDTMPVTLVFEGKYFAASPYGEYSQPESTGVFQEQPSGLIFQNTTKESLVNLEGPYQYHFGVDGSLRIWQQNGTEKNEMVLRLK